MSISDLTRDPGLRQRLLEGWLPLAQEANRCYGWELDAVALEALVARAAPALRCARNAFEAYAILWATHTRASPDEPRP